MKKMQLQSFNLKLSEIKEFEQARQQRAEAKAKECPDATGDPIIIKCTKTKVEIRERIGLKPTNQ
jgi:hypothetical protein